MISDDSSAEVRSGITGDCTWTLDGTILTISGNGAIADYDYYSKPSPWGRSITEVVIENGVTSIGDYAFYFCEFLTSVSIGNDVKSIGERAFHGCRSLTSLTIPNSVTSIGRDVFINCRSLTFITIPNSVRSIGWGAFSGCTSLTSITIPSSVTTIGHNTFSGCSSLTTITIPGGVTSIDGWAFSRCSSLTFIAIPDSVISIGDYAFSHCTSLTKIDVDSSNPKYCSYDDVLFTRDKSELIQCPGGMSGSYIVPSSVLKISYYAFRGCTSLTSITIPNSVTFIGRGAFIGCTSLTMIDVDSSNPNYCSYDNILFTKDKSELIQCPGGRSGDYTIPNGVISIGDSAFKDCRFLTSITLPNSVTSIGYGAFSNCTSLTSITLPNSVISIEWYAFSSCTSLTSITLPNSVISIEWYAFSSCTSLASITIPSSVTSIGDNAFFPFEFYESNGIDNIEPTAENLAGHTFINKSGNMVKQEEAPSATIYTVTFRVNGNVIDTVSYENGATSITEPKIPNIKGYDARWPQYTLSGDITVDAILTPKEYNIYYKVDGNVTFTESHKYDTKVTVRDTYSDGKNTYTPWTTSDVIVTNNTFTMIDSDVTFNSTSSAVKYTFIVKYVDTDGKEIRPQYQGEARCESIISPDIPSISGYRSPDERISIKITEDPSKNVVIYTYSLEDVETEGSSGFPMTYVIVGAIVAVIAIAAIAFVIKKH